MSTRRSTRHLHRRKPAPGNREFHLLVFKVGEEITLGGLYTSHRRAEEASELAPYDYKIMPMVVNEHLFVQAILNRMEAADGPDGN